MGAKAFAYLRVSGKGQIEGDGFPRQRQAIEKYACERGVEIAGEFCEKGVTGDADGPDRPAWVEMAAAMLANGVRTVIVEKLDRLARQQGLQEYMIYDMRKRGITILSAHEDDLDETDPARVMFRQLMGVFAQYEKSMIVLKLRGARQRKKAATGRCEGAKPYGHDPKRPSERPIMESIVALHQSDIGRSVSSIADELNEHRVPTRNGGKWHPHVVAQIIRTNVEAF
jgi:DNA invertase Pin-like site-specific DNA recombinase